jgi:hypothetical protein
MKSGTVLMIWLRFFADSLIASILDSTDLSFERLYQTASQMTGEELKRRGLSLHQAFRMAGNDLSFLCGEVDRLWIN